MFIALILCLLFSTSNLLAQSPCEIYFLSSPEHIKLYTDKNQSWFSRIQELKPKGNFIHSISELPQEIKGRVSVGIFRAETPEGDYVLKLLPEEAFLDMYGHKILLQKHLSNFGLAPKVRNVYFKESLDALKAKFDQVSPHTNIGILMEEVDGTMIKQAFIEKGKIPNLSQLPRSPEFNQIVRSNLQSLEKALNDLEVSVLDAQMIITNSGEVKLIDFDFYEWSIDPIMRENRVEANFDNILELFP